MDRESIKSIIIAAVWWIVCYGMNCLFAVPDGGHDEEDYIPLPKPIAYIMFLPLAIGKCRSYMLFSVIMQGALFLLTPALFLMDHLVQIGIIAEDRSDLYLKLAFVAIVLICIAAHIIRRLVKRPRKYYPRSRKRSALRRRIRRHRRR